MLCYALTCALSAILRRDGWGAMGVRSMNVTCGNTAFIGIPFCVAAFGQEAALPGVLATTVLAVLNVSLTLLCLEIERQQEASSRALLVKIAYALITNPLLIAVACGIAFALLAGAPPEPVAKLFQSLGMAAIPCSLVSIGVFISQRSKWWEQRSVIPLAMLKLAVLPALAWLLATRVFQLEQQTAAVLVVLAAMPPASTGFVIAQRYGTLVDESAAMLVFTTIMSVMTLALLLNWLKG